MLGSDFVIFDFVRHSSFVLRHSFMRSNGASQQPSGLVRALGPIDATMIVIGSMIGSGIFITSAETSRLSGAPGWLLLAWALAGLLTITGALCCSELATMMPRAGGVYVFLREAFGSPIGFLYGWTLFLVIQTGTIAAVAIAFAKFLGVFVTAVSPDSYLVAPISLGGYAISLSTEQLVAVALIALLTWTNTRGLEVGKIVQNTFTFAKTAALAAVVVIGLSLGWKANSAALSSAWWDSWANGWNPQVAQPSLAVTGGFALALLFGRSMVGPLFAQTAWTNVTFIGSEVRDPGKNLMRALVGGCGVVVVLYLLANIAYLAVLPFPEIQHAPQNRVAVAMMNAVFGHPGAMCMAAAIMISTFGCDNGLILAGARVYYAMARDGLFFRKIATTNRFRVPAAALVAQGIWTALLVLPRTMTVNAATHQVSYGNVYNQLLEYIVSADLLFYILMVVAVILLRRKRPDVERPYRTWGYPIVPIISILLSGLLIIDLGWLAPATSGIGMLIVLTGVPAYLVWRLRAVRRPGPF
jgi:APA family basic amino acid/polyamine antiporter